jgi:hypothetical protein
MPHGSPPRLPDGSISITTMEEYDRHAWNHYFIIGLDVVAVISIGLGCWRWVRREKDSHG